MRIAIVVFSIFLSSSLWAQLQPSPYKLNWAVDGAAFGLGLGTNIGYLLINKRLQPLPEQELLALRREDINRFDRSAAYNWSPRVASVSDIGLYLAIASPAALLLSSRIRNDYGKVAVLGLQTFTLSTGLTNITKALVKRPRPYLYNPDAPASFKEKKDSRYSFFSGHTSVTAAMSFYTAQVYHDYHSNPTGRIVVWSAAALLPATVGFLRWRAGKHFWTDILTGYLVGAATGILVPQVHRWLNTR